MQLSLLNYQPPPELTEESSPVTPLKHGQSVIANDKPGKVYHDDGGKLVWIERGNVATPHDRPTVQPCEPPKPVVNAHAIAWQEDNIAYYRKLMVHFMDLQRLDAVSGTANPQKQAMRRHMISVLQSQCVLCLTKIEQLKEGTDANT
jgi:hypothetical protein